MTKSIKAITEKPAPEAERVNVSSKEEQVDHPSHYNFSNLEVIDVIEAWGLDKDFLLGNVIKYIARSPHKGKFLEDLKKALWYLQRRIENENNRK